MGCTHRLGGQMLTHAAVPCVRTTTSDTDGLLPCCRILYVQRVLHCASKADPEADKLLPISLQALADLITRLTLAFTTFAMCPCHTALPCSCTCTSFVMHMCHGCKVHSPRSQLQSAPTKHAVDLRKPSCRPEAHLACLYTHVHLSIQVPTDLFQALYVHHNCCTCVHVHAHTARSVLPVTAESARAPARYVVVRQQLQCVNCVSYIT
jgi:hypothetical protein